jgi:Protein of unknown function (DUF3455)
MRTMLWLGGSSFLLAVMACATGGPPPPPEITVPTVPAEIQAPAGAVPVAKLAAKGTQNYRCEPTDTGTTWKLVAPAADLTDSGGTVVAKHGFGPSWHHNDGSALVGDGKNAKRVAAPDGTSIPWLLVPATPNGKPGVFWEVVFVQRIDTQGGGAPAGGCALGAETQVDYTATYVFYRKA